MFAVTPNIRSDHTPPTTVLLNLEYPSSPVFLTRCLKLQAIAPVPTVFLTFPITRLVVLA